MNNLPDNLQPNVKADTIKQILTTLNNNSPFAITLTITLGCCYLYKTYTDAKYNRETKISYTTNTGFNYVSHPVTTNNSITCLV